MKKLGLLISIIALMFLSGCLSEKTKEKLNEVPATSGGGIVVTGNTTYIMKTTVNTPQTTYQGNFMEFLYPTDTVNLKDGATTGVVAGAETITIEDKINKATLITVTSYENKTVNNNTEIQALVTDKISSTAVITETAKGGITFALAGQGTYSLGTVVDGAITYYYYVAQVTKSLTKTGATETTNFTYLVRTIVKTNSNTDLRNFEDVIRSIESKERSQVGVNLNLDKEKALLTSIKDFEGFSLASDSAKTSAENAVEAVYVYVENNKNFVPSTIIGQDNRRKAAMKYINTWVIDGDGTIGTKVKSLLGRIETAYKDDLGGAVATAQMALATDKLKVFKIPNVDSIKTVLEKMIEKRVEQEVIAGYDFGQKINKDIAMENLREKYGIVTTAVELIVNHYVESVRVDGLGRNEKPVSIVPEAGKPTKYTWREFQGINVMLPIMEKAIDYQQYLEIELADIIYMKLGNLSEITAREYVRKKAIESLKISKAEIGYNKIGDKAEDYDTVKSLAGEVFVDAIKSIREERISNLNDENRDFFIKARTAETIDQVNMNDLVNSKNRIELTLFNLVKFVKMFDSNVVLTNNVYKSIDTVKDNILAGGNLAQYQGINPTNDYIVHTKDNYETIKTKWYGYYVYAGDTLLKYFDSAYKLDNN